jgi:hypothetical protein
MSDASLFVLVPWIVFAGGLATVMLLAFTGDRRRDRLLRRCRRRLRR